MLENEKEVNEQDLEKPQRIRVRVKLDPRGKKYYGRIFSGYVPLPQLRELLPVFKEYYYVKRLKKPDLLPRKIIKMFIKEMCAPQNKLFFPTLSQYKHWSTMWDTDIEEQLALKNGEITIETGVRQLVTTQTRDLQITSPEAGDIEAATRTLAGDLLNDAHQMLKRDQAIGEIYDDDVLMKRRGYIVNVLAHATKLAHGRASIDIKAKQNQREEANFLMDILAKATAGELSAEEMEVLESTVGDVPVPTSTIITEQPNE